VSAVGATTLFDRPGAMRKWGGLARDLYYASAAYQWRLGRSRATQLLFTPADLWPGSSEIGAAVVAGAVSFTDEPVPAEIEVHPEPHGFAWLRDLRATGTEAARRRGRELIRDWIDRHGRYHRRAWQVDLLSERIINWLSHYDYFCRDADASFRDRFFLSLARQSRHLARIVRTAPRGAARLRAAKGLLYAGACVPGATTRLERGLQLLEQEASGRIHPDGGVFERSPSRQFEVLRDLVDARAILVAAHREASSVIQTAIDRTAPMLRFFRHGDGGLAIFNGSFEEADWQIDVALNQSGSTGKAPKSAPHTGFQRIVSGRTTVIVDTGAPAPTGYDDGTHAGTLGFELSVGRARLIVNCGSAPPEDYAWRHAGRATAAHSTMVIGETNSSHLITGGGLGQRPTSVTSHRRESEGATLVEARHDGYARAFGLVHTRRLYLSSNGEDLRGEDSVEPAIPGRGRKGTPFAIRFHLHPEIEIKTMSAWERGNQLVEFDRPGAGIWRLHTEGGADLSVEDSFYQGVRGMRRRSIQIVLNGAWSGGEAKLVRWAIRRLK
jgi:uncharacterized heparinase superfamily protein